MVPGTVVMDDWVYVDHGQLGVSIGILGAETIIIDAAAKKVLTENLADYPRGLVVKGLDSDVRFTQLDPTTVQVRTMGVSATCQDEGLMAAIRDALSGVIADQVEAPVEFGCPLRVRASGGRVSMEAVGALYEMDADIATELADAIASGEEEGGPGGFFDVRFDRGYGLQLYIHGATFRPEDERRLVKALRKAARKALENADGGDGEGCGCA